MINPKLKNLYLDSDTVLDDGNTDSSEDDGQPRIKRPPLEEPVEIAETPEDENSNSNQEEQGW